MLCRRAHMAMVIVPDVCNKQMWHHLALHHALMTDAGLAGRDNAAAVGFKHCFMVAWHVDVDCSCGTS